MPWPDCGEPSCICQTDADCPWGQACDVETNSCVALECLTDAGCPLGEVCRDGQCLADVDADRDGDGIADLDDPCPELQDAGDDLDGDGIGDACDGDDDGDGVGDQRDSCPTVANSAQLDHDDDGLGNSCDPDWQGLFLAGSFFSPVEVDWATARVVLCAATCAVVPVDSHGAFAVSGLEPGLYVLEAEVAGHLPSVTAVPLHEDETLDPIQLHPSGPADGARAIMRGGVVLSDGLPPRGVYVRLRQRGEVVAATVTNGDGAFVLEVEPTASALELNKEGYLTRVVEVSWDGEDGEFEVEEEPLERHQIVLARAPAEGRLHIHLDMEPDWVPELCFSFVESDRWLELTAEMVSDETAFREACAVAIVEAYREYALSDEFVPPV